MLSLRYYSFCGFEFLLSFNYDDIFSAPTRIEIREKRIEISACSRRPRVNLSVKTTTHPIIFEKKIILRCCPRCCLLRDNDHPES